MAMLHHAGAFATDSLQWAVSEVQRSCFQSDLDHTRHGPIEDLPAEPFPELVNKPTGNPYFDRMLKSDVGLKFLELTNSKDICGDSRKGLEAAASQCDGKSTPLSALTSCLSVVVVKQDGTRREHSMTLNASDVAAPEASAPMDNIDDTLTKRSSAGAVAAAVQSLKDEQAHLSRVSGEPEVGKPVLNNILSNPPDAFDWEADPAIANMLANLPNISLKDFPEERDVPCTPIRELENKLEGYNAALGAPLGALAGASEPVWDSPAHDLEEMEERQGWQVGSVLEVFSASSSRWYPALVTQVVRTKTSKEMLTAQFWLNIEEAKQKALCRDSELLATLGSHCGDQLPPGFQISASKSRPGMFVFLDATTGLKYESLELIWAVHFKRWLEQAAPDGTKTISSVAAVVASTRAVTVDMSRDAEAFGLLTHVVVEAQPVTAAATAQQSAPTGGYEAGFEDADLDAWAPYMKWAAKEDPVATAAEEQKQLQHVTKTAAAAAAALADNFDPWAPWTTPNEAFGPVSVSDQAQIAKSAFECLSDDDADTPPDDEFVAYLPTPTAQQSLKRFNLAVASLEGAAATVP